MAFPIEMKHKQGGSPYSMDANLLHISFEGRHLEDPAGRGRGKSMWRWTVSPGGRAGRSRSIVDLEFEHGDLVAINGTRMKPHELLAQTERAGWQAWHWSPGSGRKPLRRDEVARLL
jgi:argininosuccinate synthase